MGIIIFIAGFFIGSIITIIVLRSQSVGSFIAHTSDPEDGPYLFLELSKDISEFYKRKYVTIKIITKNFNAHK